MDLWLVTCVWRDRQSVIARAGRWADLAPPGAEFAWHASFCVQMVTGAGPRAAPDVAVVPVYEQLACGPLAKVRAYLGVPLQIGETELFGTLCAFAGTVQPNNLVAELPTVTLLARMLSSQLAGERTAQHRSREAADAYALAVRDRLTGLRNRRGFQAMLTLEQARCRRFGNHASLLVLDIDNLKTVNDRGGRPGGDTMLRSCADLLRDTCADCDVTARIEGDQFAVLAVESDLISGQALAARLRRALRAAAIRASIGVATRRFGEDLTDTWLRAEQELRADRRRRGHLTRT